MPPGTGRARVAGSASVPGAGAAGQYGSADGGYGQPDATAVAGGWDRDDVLRNPRRPGDPRSGDGGPPGPKSAKKRRRRRRIALIASGTAFVVFVAVLGVGYALVNVPLPEALDNPETSFMYYKGGGELARYATENREEVPLSRVPPHVQQAVIATEDKSFYTNKGISPTGIARAISGLVTGEDKGGGSTITQQYIKNSHKLTQERSFTRKAKEIPMAIKADQKYSKEQILEFYLNTIYFGRGAYGIQAASKTYFKKDVGKLTPEEGAVLAGLIKDPTNLSPLNNLEGAKKRWTYVLGSMAEENWYPKEKVATAVYPKFEKKAPENWKAGARGLLARAVEREVASVLKLQNADEATDLMSRAGLKVYTTVDPRIQNEAIKAAASAVAAEQDMDSALVAIQPGTGNVLAYYGGKGNYGDADQADRRHAHFAGSSMKPYVLARAIDNDISIKSVWDGSSPQKFEDRQTPLKNAGNDNSCRQCSLIDSTKKSLNTVYWALTREVGPNAVKDLAAKAGIKRITDIKTGAVTNIENAKVDARIGIGAFEIPVIDQATGYATFANNGKYVPAHFVDKVVKPDGTVLYDYKQNAPPPEQAFSEGAAKDAGFAMQSVVKASKNSRLRGGRPAAGKTGTHDYKGTADNSNVWMCGYTPQIASAVWVGSKKGENALRFKTGEKVNSQFTAKIWKTFMDAALKGQPEEPLPDPVFKGEDDKGNIKVPVEPSENPNPFPTAFPTLIPTERPDPPDDDPTEPPNLPTTPPFPTGRPSETKPPGFP